MKKQAHQDFKPSHARIICNIGILFTFVNIDKLDSSSLFFIHFFCLLITIKNIWNSKPEQSKSFIWLFERKILFFSTISISQVILHTYLTMIIPNGNNLIRDEEFVLVSQMFLRVNGFKRLVDGVLPFQVLYRETATKCMVCEEQNRTVTLSPCNHYVVCSTCAPSQRECPYCQTPVVSTS